MWCILDDAGGNWAECGVVGVAVEEVRPALLTEGLVLSVSNSDSKSMLCCRRNRIRCSCNVAWISVSLTSDLAIFSSADTFVIPRLLIWLWSSLMR